MREINQRFWDAMLVARSPKEELGIASIKNVESRSNHGRISCQGIS